MIKNFSFSTKGQGLFEITDPICSWVREAANHQDGLLTLFIKHTSASFIIQENADPSAKRDLESWLSRLVKEGDPLYTHTAEGVDDMPAHIKAVLTQTSLSIPVQKAKLTLGTWQGIYLWEHRRDPHQRQVVGHLLLDKQVG